MVDRHHVYNTLESQLSLVDTLIPLPLLQTRSQLYWTICAYIYLNTATNLLVIMLAAIDVVNMFTSLNHAFKQLSKYYCKYASKHAENNIHNICLSTYWSTCTSAHYSSKIHVFILLDRKIMCAFVGRAAILELDMLYSNIWMELY